MKAIVYVDGFNLYFRALKHRRALRWLNIRALAERMLSKDDEIIEVNYFTARVSGKIDPGSDIRQDAYLRALASDDKVNLHFGKFTTREKWAKLVHPPQFKPSVQTLASPWPSAALTLRSEEKGSDVNLGVRLVRDAFLKRFDVAVVITDDTDLEEAVRIVRAETALPVILLSPVETPAHSLRVVASVVKIIRAGHLAASQFPDVIETAAGKKITRPEAWKEAT